MLDEVRPLGICPHCDEPVMPYEPREYITLYDPPSPPTRRLAHMECFVRPLLGSVAHIERRCSCYIPGASNNDDPALTRRQAAQASVEAYRLVNRARVLADLRDRGLTPPDWMVRRWEGRE